MQEYPKMLYKLGGTLEVDGKRFTNCVVGSAEEEAKAKEDGFHLNTVAAGAVLVKEPAAPAKVEEPVSAKPVTANKPADWTK